MTLSDIKPIAMRSEPHCFLHIADLQSAERRIGTTRRSFPTPRRVQLCDTAESNSALR
jgi:hypothetical protein